MLHPSYNELMDYVNENAAPQENGEPLVQSRYTLVMAAAKRARQIVDARSKVQGSFTAADKPLSVAVKELYSGDVRILGENEEPDPVIPEEMSEEAADGLSDPGAEDTSEFKDAGYEEEYAAAEEADATEIEGTDTDADETAENSDADENTAISGSDADAAAADGGSVRSEDGVSDFAQNDADEAPDPENA